MDKNEFKNIQKFQNIIKNHKEKIKIKKHLKYNITIIIYCKEYKYLSETLHSLLYQIDIYNEIIIVYDNNDENNIFYNTIFIYQRFSKGE